MIIRIDAKCSDCCYTEITDENGEVLASKDGYVPEGIGIGGGDYIRLEIDLDTGQILNWKKPESLQNIFEE